MEYSQWKTELNEAKATDNKDKQNELNALNPYKNTLNSNSVWYTNDKLNSELTDTLNKSEQDIEDDSNVESIWEISGEQLRQIREQAKNSNPSTDRNTAFHNIFGSCRKKKAE